MHDAELVAPLGSAWPRDQEHNKPQYLAHYQRFGRVWVWQSCKVCLWPTVCKAQQRLGCSVPYHAGKAGSCAGSCANSRSFPLPPLQEGKEAPAWESSLPPCLHPCLACNELTGWAAIWPYMFWFGNQYFYERHVETIGISNICIWCIQQTWNGG